MKTSLLWLAVLILILIAAFYAFNSYIYTEKQADTTIYSFGSYAYRCQDGTEFTIAPNETMTDVLLTPASEVERIPETILSMAESESGVLYEGNGIRLHGQGETVTLSTEAFSTTCSPLPNPDEPPLNFGD